MQQKLLVELQEAIIMPHRMTTQIPSRISWRHCWHHQPHLGVRPKGESQRWALSSTSC